MTDNELKVATQFFLESEYGQYVMDTLTEMREGYLSGAEDPKSEYPIRHLDRAVAIKEVIKLINSPLED